MDSAGSIWDPTPGSCERGKGLLNSIKTDGFIRQLRDQHKPMQPIGSRGGQSHCLQRPVSERSNRQGSQMEHISSATEDTAASSLSQELTGITQYKILWASCFNNTSSTQTTSPVTTQGIRNEVNIYRLNQRVSDHKKRGKIILPSTPHRRMEE